MYLLSKKEKLSYNVALGISITQIIIFLILNFITFIFILINEGISYEDNPYSVFKDKDCDEFFSSCMIFLLESEPYKNNDWNHGYVSYIAKNERILDMIPYNLKWLRNKISNRLEDYIVSIDNECSYFCKKYYLIGLKDGIKLKKELEM